MNDDQHRARKDHAPANFAALEAHCAEHYQSEHRQGIKSRKVQKGGSDGMINS